MAAASHEFWRNGGGGGWATAVVIFLLVAWQLLSSRRRRRRSRSPPDPNPAPPVEYNPSIQGFTPAVSNYTLSGESKIISDADLRDLISDLDGSLNGGERWEEVIDKKNDQLSYRAKYCKPKVGPLKYLSTSVFENCSTELLRDFYMDNEYRKEWDKTIVLHEQLQVDETYGMEIGRTVKKFPLLTPREYILVWRVWEGKDKTFYCFIKDCEHPHAPRHKKYVRVGFFRSGWRIRKVHGRDACEITMVHQEDAGLNVEMAKMAFSKGIWSYVCKMDKALREYSTRSRISSTSVVTMLGLIQKFPLAEVGSTQDGPTEISGIDEGVLSDKPKRKLVRKPSKKMIANGLLILGGIACLSRGRLTIGTQIVIGCVLKKVMKQEAKPGVSEGVAKAGRTY